MLRKLGQYVVLLRMHQYIKNGFIFLPIFFAGKITDELLLLKSAIAFVGFSLAASAVYILNDIKDIDSDKQHPLKQFRPLASGSIKKTSAVLLMLIFLTASFFLMNQLAAGAVLILFVYLINNLAYSFYVKHLAILDITLIAIGFVLRLQIGSVVTGIPLSQWIVIMTFLLALFLALAKRRDDNLIYIKTGIKTRKVIMGYSPQFIDNVMMIMASIVVVSYILYTTSPEITTRLNNNYVYITSLFVILGIMRYLQRTIVEEDSGSPTKIILSDWFIQTTIMCWIASFVWIIYV